MPQWRFLGKKANVLVIDNEDPAYTAHAVTPREAAALLRRWTRLAGHHFWASPAADDPELYARAIGHQQVNDAWLVRVAKQNAGRWVTLDARVMSHNQTFPLLSATSRSGSDGCRDRAVAGWSFARTNRSGA